MERFGHNLQEMLELNNCKTVDTKVHSGVQQFENSRVLGSLGIQCMKNLWVWCVCLPLCAVTVPGRYIVELSTEPVAARVASMGRRGLRSQAAVSHRALIRAEHARA